MPNLWENDHRTLHVVLLDGASTTVTISLVYKRSIFSSKCEPEAHKRHAYHTNSQSRHNKTSCTAGSASQSIFIKPLVLWRQNSKAPSLSSPSARLYYTSSRQAHRLLRSTHHAAAQLATRQWQQPPPAAPTRLWTSARLTTSTRPPPGYSSATAMSLVPTYLGQRQRRSPPR